MEGLTYDQINCKRLRRHSASKRSAGADAPGNRTYPGADPKKEFILLPQADASMQTNDFSFTRSKTISPTSPKTVLCAFIRGKLSPGD